MFFAQIQVSKPIGENLLPFGQQDWEWGQDLCLTWIPEGKGVRYLAVQVGFHLPMEANLNKLMSFKFKMIAWGNSKLSFIRRILVANQVLSSMWYLVACWEPNLSMCDQLQRILCNFIQGGRAVKARAKVNWNFIILPIASGGLGIIVLKAQSKALLAKSLVRVISPGGQPWKDLLKYKVKQVQPLDKSHLVMAKHINWIFIAK